MNLLNNVIENNFISLITSSYNRSTSQLNKIHESDAELIQLPGSDNILAVTTDSIVEEIESGLYRDPYHIGWMAVMVNISDLSAVGAAPLGILLNETLLSSFDKNYLSELHRGIKDACLDAGTCILGGDTNFSSRFQIGACAIGIIGDNKTITRIGAKTGDYVFTSGPLGSGNAFAMAGFLNNKNMQLRFPFYPKSRIKEGNIIRKYATSCMDTSDGTISTLDQMMRLNNIGFSIDESLEKYIDQQVLEFSSKINIPAWLNLAGIHGEFELIFTINETNIESLLSEADKIGWKPIQLGKVTDKMGLKMKLHGECYEIDSLKIRNLYDETKGNIENYINELFELNKNLNIKYYEQA